MTTPASPSPRTRRPAPATGAPDAEDALPPTPRASDEDADRPRFRAPGDVAVVADGEEPVEQPDKTGKPKPGSAARPAKP